MPNKTPAIISAVLTFILLLLVSALASFMLLVAFNGYSERVGGIALLASLVCQGIGNILAVIIAWRLTIRFITKSNWGSVGAVLVSSIVGLVAGAGLTFISMLLSTLIAQQTR